MATTLSDIEVIELKVENAKLKRLMLWISHDVGFLQRHDLDDSTESMLLMRVEKYAAEGLEVN